MKIKSIIFTVILGVATTLTAFSQQLKTPAPSPTQTIDQAFGLSNIKIEYSRPSVKDRVIFGDLVPYDKIWRTGANAATKVTFGDEVSIEGTKLAAGTYAMYTMPGRNSWAVLFYKDLTLGGDVENYKNENEALRVNVKPSALTEKVETFTINIGNITATSATIDIMWDKTKVSCKVTTDIDEKVMKNIETALAKDSRPYFQAANYYFENNKDLTSASMGSTASGLNSLASTTTIDIYKRLINKDATEQKDLKVSRWSTVGWGIFCVLIGIYAGKMGNLLEAVNILGSLFYGTILGIFVVAFYLKKVQGKAVFYAAIVTEIFIVIAWQIELTAFLWLNVFGCLLVMLFAWLIQLIINKRTPADSI